MQAQTTQMIPLFEIFTSSTCPPCKPGNITFNNVVAGKPATDYVVVKYQQGFPGTGDPYTTAETMSRRTTPYAISSVPRLEINGGWNQNAGSFTNALYVSARAVTPKYELTGTYYVNTTTKLVTVNVTYKNIGTVTSPKLYVAIAENLTTGNKKSNGETQFEDVVKKMLPNQSGTALTVNSNVQTKSFTFQFNGNYRLPANGLSTSYINNSTEHSVEQFTDLKVVAWIQGSDKTVYQSANLTVNASTGIESKDIINVDNVSVYPNPMANEGVLAYTLTESNSVSIEIINALGQIVASDNLGAKDSGEHKYSIDGSKLTNGIYFVNIKVGENSTTKKISILK